MALQEGAYSRAWKLVNERRQVIETVAEELCSNNDETVSGERLVELLENTPITPYEDNAESEQDIETMFEEFGPGEFKSLAQIIIGQVSEWDMVPKSVLKGKAAQVKAQLMDPVERERLKSVETFVSNASLSNFPRAPKVPKGKGVALNEWN